MTAPRDPFALPATSRDAHPDDTSYEIQRQPRLLQQALDVDLGTVAPAVGDRTRTPVLIGCGTSYFLALAGAARMREHTGAPAVAVPAGDIWLAPQRELEPWPSPVVIAISRSGDTTEVVRGAEVATSRNLPVVALTTDPGSALAHVADTVIALPESAERSVVMTGSFTSMLLVLERLAASRAGTELDVDDVPAAVHAGLAAARAEARRVVGNAPRRYVFLGTGAAYAVALEGMLKMKEMTQIDSQAFPSLEFRHGPISVVDDETTVVLLHRGRPLDADLADDLAGRGATVVAVGPGRLDTRAVHSGVELPERPSDALPMPFLQWLAYEQAVALGKDPDTPRGLTQVVRL